MVLLQFSPIFHFMFLGFLESFATLLASVRAPSALKGIVQGFFWCLPMPQGLSEQEDTAWRYGTIKVLHSVLNFLGMWDSPSPKNAAKCLPEGMWTTSFYTQFLHSYAPVIFHTWITCWQVIFSFGTCLSHIWNRQILCQIAQLDWLCSFMAFLKSTFPLVGI